MLLWFLFSSLKLSTASSSLVELVPSLTLLLLANVPTDSNMS